MSAPKGVKKYCVKYWSPLREHNPGICNSTEECGGYYAKWNKPDREIWHGNMALFVETKIYIYSKNETPRNSTKVVLGWGVGK